MTKTQKQERPGRRCSISVRKAEPTGLVLTDGDFESAYKRFWRELTGPIGARLRAYLEASALRRWDPAMDVLRLDGTLVIRIDLPGVRPEAINITVQDDFLVVKGWRWEDEESQTADYYLQERTYGDFCRAIRLPDGVLTEGVTATYQDGMLEITVPNPGLARPKILEAGAEE